MALSLLTSVIRNLYLLYVVIFIIGLCQSIGLIQGYAYNIEAMPFNRRNLIITFTCFYECCLVLTTTLYFRFNPGDWLYVMIPATLVTMTGLF